MKEQILHLAGLNLYYANVHFEDIPFAKMCDLPDGMIHHAAWLAGHMTVSCEMAAIALGLPPTLPEGWHELFGIGVDAVDDASCYPHKDELLDAFLSEHTRVCETIEDSEPEDLARTFHHELLEDIFPTIGHFAAAAVTVHEAIHLGQLSVWRQVNGMALFV